MKNYCLILAAAVVLSSCGDASDPAATPAKKKPTPAEQLAVLDNIFDTADIKSIRIKTLLNDLSGKYGEPTDSIAEYTYRAQSVLHDRGIEETNLGMLEEMRKLTKLDNTPYKDAITTYLLIRANQ